MNSRTLVPTCFSIGSHKFGRPNEIVYGSDRRAVRPHCRRWDEDVSCPRLDLTAANTTCLPLNSSTREGRTVRHPDEAKPPSFLLRPVCGVGETSTGSRRPQGAAYLRGPISHRDRERRRRLKRKLHSSKIRALDAIGPPGVGESSQSHAMAEINPNAQRRPDHAGDRTPRRASEPESKERAGRGCGRRFLPQGMPRPGDG